MMMMMVMIIIIYIRKFGVFELDGRKCIVMNIGFRNIVLQSSVSQLTGFWPSAGWDVRGGSENFRY
jgi:hypothetical protein